MSAAEETVLPDAPDAPTPADQEAKETVHAVPATTSVPAASPEARPKSARERKAVEVFKPEAPKVADHTIQQGKGTKLMDIPNVHFCITSNFKGDHEVIQELHKIFYNRPGKTTMRKKDVLQFSGFIFSSEEEAKGKEKILERIDRVKVPVLNTILNTFELSKEGTKEEKCKRLAEFLEEPKATGTRDLAAADAKKKADAKRKREKAKVKAAPASASKVKSTKKDKKKEEEEEEEAEAEEEEEEAPPPKKRRTSDAQPKAKMPEPPAPKKEKAPPAKSKASKTQKKTEDAAEEDPVTKAQSTGSKRGRSSAAAAAAAPSDEELIASIESIVKDKDIETFSMKQLMVDLGVKFPGVDLTERKPFVKEYASSVIEEMQKDMEVEAKEEAPAAEGEEAQEEEAQEEEPKEEAQVEAALEGPHGG